jgi:hypothetical protein
MASFKLGVGIDNAMNRLKHIHYYVGYETKFYLIDTNIRTRFSPALSAT